MFSLLVFLILCTLLCLALPPDLYNVSVREIQNGRTLEDITVRISFLSGNGRAITANFHPIDGLFHRDNTLSF